MSAPVPLNSGNACCVSPCSTSPQNAVPGPKGEDAFSFTTAPYTQPGVGANVTISLTHDGWVPVGGTIFVQGGGFYTVVSVSGLSAVITNNGSTSNSVPGTVVASTAKVSPGGVGGTTGNAFTTTAANFVQPASGAQVNVQVAASNWAAVGQRVFVATGGYYTVFSIPDATHLNLTNNGDPGNAAPAAVINFPQQVSPAGLRGPTGATGVSSLNAVSPTTTKGDLIVDNGANSPLAGDVRLGVGTNGKALVADSTQGTGLNYATITPNTVATSGDIAIFNGTTGTPTPLQDSKLLISAAGALQSTPGGGNARGAGAVDLQQTRTGPAQVASGTNSAILSGESNTASNTDSVVAGGNQNSAIGFHSAIVGGIGNLSSGSNSFVGAGNTNTASAPNSTCLGGASNSSTGAGGSVVCGGDSNVSGGTDSFVGGGNTCVASAQESAVLCGNTNSATAQGSTVIGGSNCKTSLRGQVAHNAVAFAAQGDCQTSEIMWSVSTTDATANVEAFLNGSGASQRALVPLNTTWTFDILVTGRSSAGVSACWRVVGGVQNNANTVSLVAAVTTTVLADGTGATWGVAGGVAVTADNVNKSLKVAVTGAVATNIRWAASARLVEVGF